MPDDYVYDQGFAEECSRLAGMEGLWDPGTQALLDELGIAPGWRCLELGAGGGSMVSWMADRVGPSGRVVAADIDTRFVDELASDVVEVRRLDVRADSLPDSEFDLVHARLLLEHLPDRTQILPRMAAALRPGGVMVVEDYDWTGFGFLGADVDFAPVTAAVLGFMADAGFDQTYGRRVTGDLESCGLVDVHGEGRARIIDPDHPGAAFFRLSFVSLKDAVVGAGRLTQEAADEAEGWLSLPGVRVLTPLMVAAVGRRG